MALNFLIKVSFLVGERLVEGATESSEYFCSFLSSKSSLSASLILSFPQCFSISLLSLSDLVAKVHRCQPVHETILVLKALLCHI